MSDVSSNCHALTVESVLYTLEHLYQFTDGKYTRFGHGFALFRVEVECSSHYVADSVREQHPLYECRVAVGERRRVGENRRGIGREGGREGERGEQ